MIRFVDLRGQDTGFNFAIFDTVTSSFLVLNGSQVWDSWKQLREDLQEQSRDRLYKLLPEWAKIESE